MDINKVFQSKHFKELLLGLGVIIILFGVFGSGVFVGFHKARFSYGWGENYHRAFGGPRGGFIRDFGGHDFINGHGTVGTVIKVESGSLIVKDRDNVEKTINVSQATTITRGHDKIQLSDIKVDDRVVIIGAPKNDGTVDAKFIRLFGI